MGIDPIRKCRRWLAAAERAGIPRANAVALATANRAGHPSVRYVLVKRIGDAGFVFFTNSLSRKGRELRDNPRASIAFYWDETGRQIRVEGRVRQVSRREADDYWQSRPREKQVASAASRQSAQIGSRRELLARARQLERAYEGVEIPRPREWTGYQLTPTRIEFWTRREPRLHERELWVLSAGRWTTTILQP